MENYILKNRPEDFFVEEIPIIQDINKYQGNYSLFKVYKKGITTFEVIDKICQYFECCPLELSYSGLKDEDACTIQVIAINRTIQYDKYLKLKHKIREKNENFELLQFLGYSTKPMKIGKLLGNTFKIWVRNLDADVVNKLKKSFVGNKLYFPMINYYDDQRFGMPQKIKNTHLIGKAIINNDLERAVLEYSLVNSNKNKTSPKNYINAIDYFKIIEPQKYTFFMNSFMSYNWNFTLSQIIENLTPQNKMIKLKNTINCWNVPDQPYDIINKLGMTMNYQYYIDNGGVISTKITARKILNLVNIHLLDVGLDEDFIGKYKMQISFFLNSGEYATMLVKQMFERAIYSYDNKTSTNLEPQSVIENHSF